MIGSLIKGVSKFGEAVLRQMPGFRIEIQEGRVRLAHIFRARLWSSQQEPQALPTLAYKKLIDIAGETEVEADVCFA